MPKKYALSFLALTRTFVVVHDDEAEALLSGFASFFCVLTAYFLLLPIRDEAGVSLGTNALPVLFTCSFLLTLLVQPLVSGFLLQGNRTPERALRQLFAFLATSLLCFYVAYLLFSPATYAATQHQAGSIPAHPTGALGDAGSQGGNAGHRMLAQAAPHIRTGDTSLSAAQQKLVRAAFFLWLSVLNLMCLSTLWARAADLFSSEAATRLFGFLGAGATCGQLAGSLLATLHAALLQRHSARSARSGRGMSHLQEVALQAAPMLLAAVLVDAAGRIAGRPRKRPRGPPDLAPFASPQRAGARPGVRGQLWRSFARMWQGFELVAASRYLCHLCLYIVLSTTISSFLFFEKSMVVAAAAGSANARMALFAQINSASAVVIAALQLAATGRLLARMGLAPALAASPAITAVLMAAIALAPSPFTVASGEVLRKVVAYALGKPAREVLYTVVSRKEKYKAKICIDTLVVRGGDALAAGAFHVLDGLLHMGASGCAAAAVPVCCGCAAAAFSLGRAQEALAAQQLRHQGGAPDQAGPAGSSDEPTSYGPAAETQRLRSLTA